MNRLVVDTSVYGAFKSGASDAVQCLREAERILVPVAVLGELYAGLRHGTREAHNRRELAEFLDSPRVEVVDVTAETCEFYAEVYRILRRKGTPIPANDMWIAAGAMQHGAVVCTADRHFTEIDGLLVRLIA